SSDLPLRQTGFLEDLSKQQAAEIRRFLGRLENDRVARRKRKQEAARRQDAGEIPGAYHRDHAHRPPHGHGNLAVLRWHHLARRLPDRSCGGMENFHHIAGLEHALAEPATAFRLDRVNDLHPATLPDLGGLVQVMRPFGEWELRPLTECLLRSLDCRCSLSPSGIWNLRPYRAIGRVEIFERLSCGRPATAD